MKLLTHIHGYQQKDSSFKKNQVQRTLLNETNKAPIIDPKEIELYELPDKEFRIILLKKFGELQETMK